MTLNQLRENLPAAKNFHFLNYAGTAPLLKPSALAMQAIAKEAMEPMPLHFNKWMARIESARRLIADTINASAEEIAFTTNTSTALSLVAAAVRWQPGDRILYLADEFPSNRYVWDNLKDRGVQAQALEPVPGIELAEQLEKEKLDKVRMVAVSAVSYMDGRRADIPKLINFCHKKNILVTVDAIQAIGAVPVDVKEWGRDFLACGGQKWLLGPVGSGFLYIAASHLENLHVPMVGWASSRYAGDFERQTLEFADGARRFEPGLPDITTITGLAKSIETLTSAGWKNIFTRIEKHNQRLRAELTSLGLPPLHNGPPETQSGIVTINVTNQEGLREFYQACKNHKIILTRRKKQLRFCAHATTEDKDIDILLKLLKIHQPKLINQEASSPANINTKTSSLSSEKEATGKQQLRLAQNSNFRSGQGAKRKKTGDGRRYVEDFLESSNAGLSEKGILGQPQWKRALVTGASRGLGEAIATALARRGCNVTLMGRDQKKLTVVADQLKKEHNILAETAIVDLSNPSAVEQWLTENQTQMDYDVLINNAASGEADLFIESDIPNIRRVFETNFFTPLLITKRILPLMLERRNGAILNIVTSGGRCALPLFSGYASSKGALWAWSESLERELIKTGVTVTTFIPPHMETATQSRISRKALAYYKLPAKSAALKSPLDIGEQAISALASRRANVIPFSIKVRLAFNAIAPGRITKQILRSWKK